MTDHTSVRRATDLAVRAFAGIVSCIFLLMALGDALTGGMRIRSGPGVIGGDSAAFFFLWLLAVLYCALSPHKGGQENG